MLIGHQRGHDRGVGRVGERLAGAEQEEHGVDQRDRDVVRGHGGGEGGERRGPAEIDHDHEAAAVEPVHVRAADQGEQQPGQLVHERRTRDKTGITGELRDKQRAGDHGDAVADVGDCAGGPDLGEVRAKRGTGGQGGLLELALDDPAPGERSAPDVLARLTPADVRLFDPGIALVQK